MSKVSLSQQGPYLLYGAQGSPYSIKMLALMRYKRLDFQWIHLTPHLQQEIVSTHKPPVIPILELNTKKRLNDSTYLARQLENWHPNYPIYPKDPVYAFLNLLLEDFADEWLTKWMFFYRWHGKTDPDLMAKLLIFDQSMHSQDLNLDKSLIAYIKERQMNRTPLVGAGKKNKGLFTAQYIDFLKTIESLLETRPFLLGNSPSLVDFAFLGQLSQLAYDPTPAKLMRSYAPLVHRWLTTLMQCSIEKPCFFNTKSSPCPYLKSILDDFVAPYLNYLSLNTIAYEEAPKKALKISFNEGNFYQEKPFKYHIKCLASLKSAYKNLSAPHKQQVLSFFSKSNQTTCQTYLDSK